MGNNIILNLLDYLALNCKRFPSLPTSRPLVQKRALISRKAFGALHLTARETNRDLPELRHFICQTHPGNRRRYSRPAIIYGTRCKTIRTMAKPFRVRGLIRWKPKVAKLITWENILVFLTLRETMHKKQLVTREKTNEVTRRSIW